MKLLLRRTEKQEGAVPAGAPGASLGHTLQAPLVHPGVPSPRTGTGRSLLSLLLRASYPEQGLTHSVLFVPDAISGSRCEMQLSDFPLCRNVGCKIA